jgi:hypothetical protein
VGPVLMSASNVPLCASAHRRAAFPFIPSGTYQPDNSRLVDLDTDAAVSGALVVVRYNNGGQTGGGLRSNKGPAIGGEDRSLELPVLGVDQVSNPYSPPTGPPRCKRGSLCIGVYAA